MKTSFLDPENWREIGATLARNKTRTFLTAFGIFWGTFMLALLYGGASGFEGIMRRNFAGFATNMAGFGSSNRTISYKGFNKGSSWDITLDDIELITKVSDKIEYISPILSNYGSAVYGSHSKSGQIMGVNDNYNKVQELVIQSGRFINGSDMANRRKVVVVGRNLANELFAGEDPIGKEVSINGIFYRVIGVAGQKSDASIGGRVDDAFIMPLTTLQVSMNKGNVVHFVVFTAKHGCSPDEIMPSIRRILSNRHYIHPEDENAFWVFDVTDMFNMIDNLFTGISLLALFVGFGSLLAGIIGVGNIMWIIVRERTQEFGIRRAIGAKPADITVQVLSESVVLTLVAGVAGVCFATLILAIMDKVTAHPVLGIAGFQNSFYTACAVVVIFLILGTLAGTIPAIKAMRIKPIEAMRDK